MKSDTTTSAPAKVQPVQRTYWEVFGELVNQLNLFKNLTFLLVGAVIFLSVSLVKSMNKMPLVIRVDALGNTAAFNNVQSANPVTTPEVNNFAQYFMQYWIAGNFHTYEDDLAKAFTMMTEDYRPKANDYLSTHGVMDYIKQNKIKTKMTISAITLKDSPRYVSLKIKGTNELRSYEAADFFKEEIFESELSLKKVERTENTPWGLLVDSWNISYYKK